MTNKIMGWALALTALGMMLVSIGGDIKQLQSTHDIYTTLFIGNTMAHLGEVILAFVGGKLIPTEPQNQRFNDPPKDK